MKYLDEMENQAQGMPEPEISERQFNARRFRTVDVQNLFEDSRRAPVSRLAPGYSVYRRGGRGWTKKGSPRTPSWSTMSSRSLLGKGTVAAAAHYPCTAVLIRTVPF